MDPGSTDEQAHVYWLHDGGDTYLLSSTSYLIAH